jgi:hypothetical protein
MSENVTVTIDAEGSTEEIALPADLVDFLAEGDPAATVVADITTFAFTQRAHAMAHHSGEIPEDLDAEAIEEQAMERFEERFGASYEEVTGHSH